MKKYFLMLAVALVMPLLFTSCGDEDDPKVEDTFPYAFPVTNWGASSVSVKAAMENSGLTLSKNNLSSLVYTTPDTFYPAYTYIFETVGLSASSLTLSEEQDTKYDFQGEIEKKYGEAVDEDDEGWYYTKGATSVYYAYNEELEGWQATFTPSTKADKTVLKQLAKENAALLQSVK